MKKIFLFFVFLVALNASKLVVATAPNYPPYEYIEDGVLKGYDVDIIEELARRINMQVEFKYMDFDALIPALQAGKVDLIGAILKKTPRRAKAVEFSTTFRQGSSYFVANISTAKEIKECSNYDFKGKKIGAETGSLQYEIAQEFSNLVSGYESNAVALMALETNKLDYVCIDKIAAMEFAKKNPKLGFYCEYFDNAKQGYAVKKGNEELLNKVNKALDEMIKDGTIEKIEKKYNM